jgi:hypothetical protein
VLAVMLGALGADRAGDRPGRFAHLLELDGAVGPATADYLIRGIDEAPRRGGAGHHPHGHAGRAGNLDAGDQPRDPGLEVPVAVHVAPSGARAASAGTFIAYAAHVAAMAPGTSIGAATPVQMGGFPGGPPEPEEGEPRPSEPAADDAREGEETRPRTRPRATGPPAPPADAGMAKAINDAVSHIRGMAELRGRNADWAERAVREAVTLTATGRGAERDRLRREHHRRPAGAGAWPHGRSERYRARARYRGAGGSAALARLAHAASGGDHQPAGGAPADDPGLLRDPVRALQSRHAGARHHWRDQPADRAVRAVDPAVFLRRAGVDPARPWR